MGTRPFAIITWLIVWWPYSSSTCHRQRKAIRTTENTNCNFSSGPFWTHKKIKANTHIVSNTPTLLSAAGPVPMHNQSQPVWLSCHPLLVSFPFPAIVSLIVV